MRIKWKISVMGTGSWGTALAILLHNNGHQVGVVVCTSGKGSYLNENRGGSEKLPGIKI